jgi:hypothetical protein
VTWRDGVHLAATPIWCDARRRRDVCFVSSADRIGRAGHGQLIATPLTLALLATQGSGHLGVPLRRRFTLGTLRLELIASGRGPGAAALHVDIAGRGVLYAGPVRPQGTPPAGIEAAEVRTCAALVVAAPFGAPHHVFPPLADVIAQVIEWSRRELAAGSCPVLLVDGVLDGIEVASVLRLAGLAVMEARAIREAVRRAADLLILQRGTDDASEPLARGRARVLVWPAGDRTGLARVLGERRRALARLSGTVLDGDPRADVAFAWASAADHRGLLGWIEATGAREVFVTGACAEPIAQALGSRARVLGPPQQMALFPEPTG